MHANPLPSDECGSRAQSSKPNIADYSTENVLNALLSVAEVQLEYFNRSKDDYVMQSWDLAYLNYADLDKEWCNRLTPTILKVNGTTAKQAIKPKSYMDRRSFLLDATERMRRTAAAVELVRISSERQNQQKPDVQLLVDMKSIANRIICELITALRSIGIEPPTPVVTSLASTETLRIMEYLLLREMLDQLQYVIDGTKAVLRTDPAI